MTYVLIFKVYCGNVIVKEFIEFRDLLEELNTLKIAYMMNGFAAYIECE